MRAQIARTAGWEVALVVLVAILGLVGFFTVVGFWSSSNFSLAAVTFAPTSLICLGFAVVLMSGEIDISVASLLGLSSAVLGKLYSSGTPLLVAVAAVLVMGMAAGLFNGYLITQIGVPSLVVTLGSLALFRGLCFVVLGDDSVSLWPGGFTSLGSGKIAGTFIPWSLIVCLGFFATCILVFHFTWIGRKVQAIGRNTDASVYAGISANRCKLGLFAVSGFLAAAAGVLETARLSNASPDNGTGLELQAIAIVLLGGVSIFGGRGNLAGVFVAVVLVALIGNELGLLGVSGTSQQVVIGILLVGSALMTNVIDGLGRRSGALAQS